MTIRHPEQPWFDAPEIPTARLSSVFRPFAFAARAGLPASDRESVSVDRDMITRGVGKSGLGKDVGLSGWNLRAFTPRLYRSLSGFSFFISSEPASCRWEAHSPKPSMRLGFLLQCGASARCSCSPMRSLGARVRCNRLNRRSASKVSQTSREPEVRAGCGLREIFVSTNPESSSGWRCADQHFRCTHFTSSATTGKCLSKPVQL